MESIAVTKPDMRIERQGTLSPFGFLTQLFTEELVRRNGQSMGYYRPMQLAYLEEAEPEAAQTPPEIHFDLNVDLIVNRLLKAEKEKSEKSTPTQRILERVILREKEIRTAYPETRRLVVEGAGRHVAADIPLAKRGKAASQAQPVELLRKGIRETRQDGERRSTKKAELLRPSASLAHPVPGISGTGPMTGQKTLERKLTLASQAMSVPAAGGWTPTERELYPGYPGNGKKAAAAVSAGSILLPDVMRRRREEALERREAANSPAGSASPEEGLAWLMEGTQQEPETERVFRELRKAVSDTIRRNHSRESTSGERMETTAAPEAPEREHPGPSLGESKPTAPAERGTLSTARASRAEEAFASDGAVLPGSGPEAARAATVGGQTPSASASAPQGGRAPGLPTGSIGKPVDGERALPASAILEAASGISDPAVLMYLEESTATPAAEGGEGFRKPAGQGEAPSHPVSGKTGRAETGTVPGGEAAAPETAAQPGRKEEKPLGTAEESIMPAGAEQPRGAVQPGSTAQPPREPAPASAGTEVVAAEAPQQALPAAFPLETAEGTNAPAEMTYREEREAAAPETTAQPGRKEAKPLGTAEESIAPAGAVQPRVAEQDGSTAQPPAEAPQQALPAAFPLETAAEISVPAEMAYREEREAAAPETAEQPGRKEEKPLGTAEESIMPAGAERPRGAAQDGRTAQPPAEAPQQALPAAFPLETAAEISVPAEMAYREEREAAAPESAAQPGRKEAKPFGTAEESIMPAGAERPRGAAQDGRTAQLPAEAPQQALPAAFPLETAAEISVPAEMAYREEREAAAPESAAQPGRKEAKPFGTAEESIMPAGAERPRGAAQDGRTAQPPREPAPASAGTEVVAAKAPQQALPAAFPLETAAEISVPAEMAYREEREAAAPETAAQPGRKEEKPLGTAKESIAPDGAVQPRVAEQDGSTAQPPREPAPASAETEVVAAEAPQQVLPVAFPLETAAEISVPAEMVYREEREAAAPETAAQPGRKEEKPLGTAEESIMPAGAEQPRGAAQDGSTAQPPREPAPASAETEVVAAEAPQQALPAAFPLETAAEISVPAEMVYREGDGADAASPELRKPEEKETLRPAGTQTGRTGTEPSRGPGAAEGGRAAVTAETILRENESRIPGIPAVLPREAVETAVQTELIYLESEAAPGEPAQTGAREPGSGITGTEIEPTRHEAASQAAPEREEKQASPGIPTALPAETAAQPSEPADLHYLESTEALVSQLSREPGTAPREARSTSSSGARPTGAESPRRELSSPGQKEDTAAVPLPSPEPETGSPGTEAATALPTGPIPQETAPPPLVYLEGENEPPQPGQQPKAEGSDGTTGPRAQISQTRIRQDKAAAARSADGKTPAGRSRSEAGTFHRAAGKAAEHAPVPAEKQPETEETAAAVPVALPAEPDVPPTGQTELIYREEAPADLPQGKEATASPAGQRAEASPDAASPIDGRTAESLAEALPAASAEADILPPVSLHLRTEGETQQGAPMGHIARDIRVTAERRSPSRLTAEHTQGQGGARQRAGKPAGDAAIRSAAAGSESATVAAPAPETAMPPEPAALVFAPLAQSAEEKPQETLARPTQKAEESKTESLPNWAKELLDKAGVTDTAQQVAAFNGRIDGANAGRQISWTAPTAAPKKANQTIAQPAELSFRERSETEEASSGFRISEAEIQRTADKVYRIIEERLRRELRRSGR